MDDDKGNKGVRLLCGTCSILFFMSFGGCVVGSMTDFEYPWISAATFILLLPAINLWLWQWLEDKRNKRFANKVLALTASLSLLAVVCIVKAGDMRIIALLLGILFLGWIVYTSVIHFETWWQRSLLVLGICILILCVFISESNTVTVDTLRLDDKVNMGVFEGISPPIIKKEFIKKYGLPVDMAVDEETGEDGTLEYEIFEYLINGKTFNIVFTDNDYEDGYIEYNPANLDISVFLKKKDAIKENPWFAYEIIIAGSEGKEIRIAVGKDNIVEYIDYYKMGEDAP